MQKILIVCDPPVLPPGQNSGGTHQGVSYLVRELRSLGHEVLLLTREVFDQIPKGQNEYKYVAKLLDGMQFDMVHLVTESRLGLYARRYCAEQGIPFTAFYGTLYPEWLKVRNNVPEWLPYCYIRWFLNGANGVVVPTQSLKDRIIGRGVRSPISVVPYGVDTDLFTPVAPPGEDRDFLGLPRPITMYCGRITVEKGVPDLCAIAHDLGGTVVLVGEGDLEVPLKRQYPHVHFAGVKIGAELARYYRAADRFVFPSTTDTFGLVVLEAMACGVPVAALPVTGPKDFMTDPRAGILDSDLLAGARRALTLSRTDCREFALGYTWRKSAETFMAAQIPFTRNGPRGGPGVWYARNINVSMRLLEACVKYYEHMLFHR